MTASARARGVLALTLAPGLGPVRIARLLEAFGSPDAVLGASERELARVRGIGEATARGVASFVERAPALVDEELERVARAGARVVVMGEAGYPPLLAEVPGAPPILMVRGELKGEEEDRYPVAIVGSRRCTAYGIEQAERFGGVLASSGLTVVSGGARGIDAAAHRGALRAGGRTIAVLGCGLGRCYPPEHAGLFEEMAGGRGAVVSELPMDAPPDAANFPARNRIISGLALGVVVIEAGAGSGALITARHAGEDHGREVFAVPGRVDSEASRGSNALIREGGAALVTEPGEVIAELESRARHQFGGTHGAVTRDPTRAVSGDASLFEGEGAVTGGEGGVVGAVSEDERAVLTALDGARTADELVGRTGLTASAVRAALTRLEISRRVRRRGSAFERA